MAVVGQGSLTNDQERYLASRLIENTLLRLVCYSVCDQVALTEGTGITANFVRYVRMNVPMATLTEGTDPSSSTFTTATLSVSLDQWGDILEVSDVAVLSVKHPLMAQIVDLLSDNAQRVIDREVQNVWLAGTNVTYGDGSAATSRATITTAMTARTSYIMRCRVSLVDGGAPPRFGPGSKGPTDNAKVDSANQSSMYTKGGHYVAIAGPQVLADITAEASANGAWVSVQQYSNAQALYNYEMGTWLSMRWVESNFLPKFRILGNTTAAVASGAAFGTDTPVVTAVDGGGTLSSGVTYFYKVTRKDLTRGFEEFISIAHSTAAAATGNNESFTFNFTGLTAGYVYNIYFDSVQAGGAGTDATLKLVASNVAVGTTTTVTGVGTATTTAPPNVNATGTPTIHPVYIHGAGSTAMVTLQNLQAFMTKNESHYGNVLLLKRAAGYKFMMKAMIKNQERIIRLEVASAF